MQCGIWWPLGLLKEEEEQVSCAFLGDLPTSPHIEPKPWHSKLLVSAGNSSNQSPGPVLCSVEEQRNKKGMWNGEQVGKAALINCPWDWKLNKHRTASDRKEKLCKFIGKERMTKSKPTGKVTHSYEFPTLQIVTQALGWERWDWQTVKELSCFLLSFRTVASLKGTSSPLGNKHVALIPWVGATY